MPIHEHLVWSGIHSTAWGFLVNKTTKNHRTERIFAPPAWVVTDDKYLLRFVGEIEPNYYKDFLNGHKPVYELYDYKNDPSETRNLASEFPDIVDKMKQIYQKESKDFLPPHHWKLDKWNEIRATP